MRVNFKLFYSHKLTWLIEHLFFAALPIHIAVMRYADKPLAHYALMALVALYTFLIAYFIFRIQPTTIGFTTANTKESLYAILPGTLLIGLLIILGKTTGIIHKPYFTGTSTILLYMFVSVPLQELVFRGLCWWRCSLSWKQSWFIVLFTSLNFAFYHIFLGNWQLVLGVLLLNLYWSYHYKKYRSLLATALSHALIGAAYFI